MKLFSIIIFFFFNFFIQAQDFTSLAFGNTIAIDEVDIEFVDVLEDSRCPKNVNCFQAGRAVILVNVFVNGEFLEERRLNFFPSGFSQESKTTLFNADGLYIAGVNLNPYPIAENKTPKKEYFLELVIKY